MLVSLSLHHKSIAWFFTVLLCGQFVVTPLTGRGEGYRMGNGPAAMQPVRPHWVQKLFLPADPAGVVDLPEAPMPQSLYGTGPGQPEMQAFTSVGNANMVDLFSGDFSYNIPLLDVGGYPVNLAYRAGVTMDQEASWVGLGWNVNPGNISRNLRGLPDDFNGAADSIRKEMHVKENRTVGVTGSFDTEIAGYPKDAEGKVIDTVMTGLTVGASLGVLYNNYRGWGTEVGLNASLNSGAFAKGLLTGGLSLTTSSMDGLSITPSFSMKEWQAKDGDNRASGSFSVYSTYNSRSGIRGLQLGQGVRQSAVLAANQKTYSTGASWSSTISFAQLSYTPSITLPYTSRQFSFTAKVGLEKKVSHPNIYLSGYISSQFIDAADQAIALPAYGYLHYQEGAKNKASLLDFNREKELPYREKPAVPHIAIPSYTYDAFSITGEGTGGMFRAYRSDIGFVHDHLIRTKDASDRVSVDLGFGDAFHGGVDLNINRAYAQNGPWLSLNTLKNVIHFRRDSADFQAAYFRNPGEKSINDSRFYETLGGDDVVMIGLEQANIRTPNIYASHFLRRYRGGRYADTQRLTVQNAVKAVRDKRTQVISYLTAEEAAAAGLSKYIEYHKVNEFDSLSCKEPSFTDTDGYGTGLKAEYFRTPNLKEAPYIPLVPDSLIDFNFGTGAPVKSPGIPPKPGTPKAEAFPKNKFSIRWTGRIKAPQTGSYDLSVTSDDGVRLWLNDTLLINNWVIRAAWEDKVQVNLVKGTLYKIRLEYFENKEKASVRLRWKLPNAAATETIPTAFLYPPPVKDTFEHNNIVREQRVNSFRKAHHISEIDVLNSDGRRYIYGIPVYNLQQKEVSFSVDADRGKRDSGLVKFNPGKDNTVRNDLGRDNYFASEEVPAYAHSFLLTGILSADYSDITGNGITADDIGDAVKFNYSKVAGIVNPYGWRAPAIDSTATYNEGLRTDYRDDRGNYIYGKKELWYLHSIESKTMIATFTLADREDLPAITETGSLQGGGTAAKLLKEINLYNKADFMARRTHAVPVKTVHFQYSYALCPGAYPNGKGKLTLQKVWFTYNGNKKNPLKPQNPYVFSYNSRNPAFALNSNDRWSSYKDPAQNPHTATGQAISNADYPYTLPDSAAAAQNAAAWALDSIYLPSGGSMKVTYESDDYAYVQNKRALQMCKVISMGNSNVFAQGKTAMYTKHGAGNWDDHRYIFIRVPKPVNSLKELYTAYLQDLKKLYFKLYVEMPQDQYSKGNTHEYVSCYANLDAVGSYGIVNSEVIWVKLAGISLKGDGPGVFSPLVKTAIQFLRMNLPSKAYPGSETGETVTGAELVKMLAATADNIVSGFQSFDRNARNEMWGKNFDTSRSFVRLDNPFFKKMGGGHRVKRITIYDNWDKMTNQRPAVYGQEYSYTTPNLQDTTAAPISSGVASYEPGIGGEENPFHYPVEYVEQISPLAPVALGYSEEPLGESFFPAAGVGYSRVRVRTINYRKTRSANGYEETSFYTARDYPTYVENTLIDGDGKKRFKPALANLLRIDAKHYLSLSQGFKIELNDMHGKLRSTASYAETDPNHPISYSEQFYRTANTTLDQKRLRNEVAVMHPDGRIDTTALIGKDVELMTDMRQQYSVTNGYNVNLNIDMFTVSMVPPYFIIPSMLNLAQREENIYRSAAVVKIIQRYGIVDSAVQIDKGSRISTRDLLYDSETGDVLLTRTQNEFNDPVYNFNYPSHWAYDGMGLAYKNIDVVLDHVNMRDGRLVHSTPAQDSLFSSGDEILVAGKQFIRPGDTCGREVYATFPGYDRIWAVDSSVLYGGPRAIFFIDRWGKAYNGYDISLKIIRSGRRNILGSVGSVTTLEDPLQKDSTGNYHLVLNTASKVIAASAGEFKQFWKVDDVLRKQPTVSCIPNWQPGGRLRCVKGPDSVNTGYQEIEVIDINPHSPSYNDTLWKSYGLNCYMCSRPAKWITLKDTFQCATDSLGNFTGKLLQGEFDTAACSSTSGHYRFIKIKDTVCTVCPVPSKWAFTGIDSCEKDSNGIRTGYLLRKQQDTASCSATHNSFRWTRERNCTSCAKPASWLPFDSVRCNEGYTERLHINMQGCSDSAWVFKWIREGGQQSAIWEDVDGQFRCGKNGDSTLNGYRLKLQRNRAACGDSTGMQRWVKYDSCTGACITPPALKFISKTCMQQGHPGKNTGEAMIMEMDTSKCGLNQLRPPRYEIDYGYCPLPPPPVHCTYVTLDSVNKNTVSVEGEPVYVTRADILVRFYKDPAHTIPDTVTDFTLIYKGDTLYNGSLIETRTYSIVCNGTYAYVRTLARINFYDGTNRQTWEYRLTNGGYNCNGEDGEGEWEGAVPFRRGKEWEVINATTLNRKQTEKRNNQ
jgi:hypothetical protein